MFKKYQHIERYGNEEVEGIDLGDCYIFPKIDGTQAIVWKEESDDPRFELICKFRREHKTKTCFHCPNGQVWQKSCHVWGSVLKYA